MLFVVDVDGARFVRRVCVLQEKSMRGNNKLLVDKLPSRVINSTAVV